MVTGYRTYITLILLVIHNVLKTQGVDIPSENLSIAADVVLAVAAFVFRMIAKPKAA